MPCSRRDPGRNLPEPVHTGGPSSARAVASGVARGRVFLALSVTVKGASRAGILLGLPLARPERGGPRRRPRAIQALIRAGALTSRSRVLGMPRRVVAQSRTAVQRRPGGGRRRRSPAVRERCGGGPSGHDGAERRAAAIDRHPWRSRDAPRSVGAGGILSLRSDRPAEPGEDVAQGVSRRPALGRALRGRDRGLRHRHPEGPPPPGGRRGSPESARGRGGAVSLGHDRQVGLTAVDPGPSARR